MGFTTEDYTISETHCPEAALRCRLPHLSAAPGGAALITFTENCFTDIFSPLYLVSPQLLEQNNSDNPVIHCEAFLFFFFFLSSLPTGEPVACRSRTSSGVTTVTTLMTRPFHSQCRTEVTTASQHAQMNVRREELERTRLLSVMEPFQWSVHLRSFGTSKRSLPV